MAAAIEADSWVGAVETRSVGLAVLALGGGRTRADQPIDYTVGISEVAGPGDRVGPGRPLALVHARSDADAAGAVAALRAAYQLSAAPAPGSDSTILVGGSGIAD